MKKWTLLLTCVLAVLCFAGCHVNFPTPPVDDGPPAYRLMFDSYDDVLTKYKQLLQGAEAASTDLPADDRDRDILAALTDAAQYPHDEAQQKGYAYLDINGDGVEELLLFSEEYFLYSVYTMQKGKPALVYDWLEGDFMHRGMIDRAGYIYASNSPALYTGLKTPLEEWYTSVWQLTEDGKLDGITLRTYAASDDQDAPRYVGSDGEISFELEEQSHVYLWRQWEDDLRSQLMGSRRHIGDAGLRFTAALGDGQTPDESLPVADLSTYDGILSVYRKMVALYPEYNPYDSYLISENYTAGYRFETDADFALYARLLTAGYAVRPQENRQGHFATDGQNAYGYAERDLNGDGIKELILLTDAYDIIAVFTMKEEVAELVCLRPDLIDDEGKIYESYTYTYSLSDEQYRIWELDESGKKTAIFTAWSGVVGPNRFAYYRLIDGKEIRIPDEEVEQFMAPFDEKVALGRGESGAEYMRCRADLTFLPIFERTMPNDSHVLPWTHFENYADVLTVVSVAEDGVRFTWHEENGESEITLEAVAAADDRFAFEADGVKGRLAFGVRCVWVIVEESEAEAVAPGAYLYDIFDRLH